MSSTLPPFKVVTDDAGGDLRAHYHAVATDTLRLVWHRKKLITTSTAMAIVIALITLTAIGPSYTSEVLIQVDLNPGGSEKRQSSVSVDATEVADSTVRIIGSRAIADSVVTRLGLDKDPSNQHQSVPGQVLSFVKLGLGLQASAPTAHELAIERLMRRVRVRAEPRSYLVSVAVTAGQPETAARLANAVAGEYLRNRKMDDLAQARGVAERDLAEAASVYGPRHPNYVRASTRLSQLEAQITSLRNTASTEDIIKEDAGRFLVPAHKVTKPSAPNVPLMLMLAILAGLGVGTCLALYARPGFGSWLTAEALPKLLLSGSSLALAAQQVARAVISVPSKIRRMSHQLLNRSPLRRPLRHINHRVKPRIPPLRSVLGPALKAGPAHGFAVAVLKRYRALECRAAALVARGAELCGRARLRTPQMIEPRHTIQRGAERLTPAEFARALQILKEEGLVDD